MRTPEEYQFFIEQINGLVAIDPEGRVTHINRQLCGEYGLDPEACIGKHIGEVLPFSKLMDTIKYKQPATTEFYSYKDHVSVRVRQPLIKGGKLVGAVEYDLFDDFEAVDSFIERYLNLGEEFQSSRDELQRFGSTKYTIENLIGYSAVMLELKEKIKYVAKSNSTVLIYGETGTGKELVAHSIHNLSRRGLQNFVKINSAGLPESLAESELFGYEPGSFTGASKEGRKGKFEIANGGTLFIDEINQMPLTLQPKLLRVLQEKEVDRIGGAKSIPVDVRIIAASNKDLKEMVKSGEFREDLYYRLDVVEIRIPPLRERREDIRHLVNNFIRIYNQPLGKHVRHVDEKAMKAMREYDWPGNVRELQNMIEKAMNYIEGDTLFLENLEFHGSVQSYSLEQMKKYERPIDELLRQVERDVIVKTLERFHGNKSRAAEFLKISRPLLYQKMRRLGIEAGR